MALFLQANLVKLKVYTVACVNTAEVNQVMLSWEVFFCAFHRCSRVCQPPKVPLLLYVWVFGARGWGWRSINTQCVPACICVTASLQGSKLKLGGNELENKGTEHDAVRFWLRLSPKMWRENCGTPQIS